MKIKDGKNFGSFFVEVITGEAGKNTFQKNIYRQLNYIKNVNICLTFFFTFPFLQAMKVAKLFFRCDKNGIGYQFAVSFFFQ